MNSSTSKLVGSILLGISTLTMAGNSNTFTSDDYILAIERYDTEAWISYDTVDRHEITTGTDRGAQLYVYRNEGGKVHRVVFDYGLSQTDAVYCLLYKDDKLVKLSHSRRGYHSDKDGKLAFCQPYPQVETSRTYFRGSEVVCLSSGDKTCEAIRLNTAKRKAVLSGASDLLRQVTAAKPESEMPDVDFLKDF